MATLTKTRARKALAYDTLHMSHGFTGAEKQWRYELSLRDDHSSSVLRGVYYVLSMTPKEAVALADFILKCEANKAAGER